MMRLKNIGITMLMFAQCSFASTSNELNHFFNNLGFSSNVTGSHVYQTQAAGYVSSGSLYMRNQVRNRGNRAHLGHREC